MTELTNRIKEEAAKTFGYESFSTAQETILNLRQKSGFEKIIDRCISLASQVEAGITVEQAKVQAAEKFGYKEMLRGNISTEMINDAMQLYASSAVQTAIEKERERTLKALKRVERYVRAHNDFELYLHDSKPFWDLLAELKKEVIITNP